jgi:serine/threonine protein kinase
MEYLEGETLEQRLRRGSLPISEALLYAVDIAGALERAHNLGITHRDLKPANIMLTKSGVKLLDFGLAKLQAQPGPMGVALTEMTVETQKLTEQGMLVGTLQYMAPEQLEGSEVDARTDVFAFGAVLYEMLAGRPAFSGKSKASLIAAILSSEPPALSSLQPLTPPALDATVRSCLAKNPEERWQAAHDVKLQLQWVLNAGSQTHASPAATGQRRRNAEFVWSIALVVALLVGAIAGIAYVRLSGKSPVALVTFIPPPEKSTFEFLGDTAGPPVISPDGRFLAFVSRTENKEQLWLRSLDSENAQLLGNTEGATFPFWSPNSRSIGFFASGKLKRIDVSGGAITSLCDAPLGRGGSWSKDSIIVFAPDFRTPLYRVPATGGEPVPVSRLDLSKQTTHRWPFFLPDGKHFLYFATSHEAPKNESTGIYHGSLESMESRLIVPTFDNAAYSDGYLFFMHGNILMAQRFDADGAKILGEPTPIASNVLNDIDTWSAVFSVSHGLLAYQAAAAVGTQLTWLDRSGRQLATLGEREGFDNIRISPQAGRVAGVMGSPPDIWIYDVARDLKTRFTFNPERDANPVWSPDGSQIVFTSGKGGHPDLYRKNADGSGSEELLLGSDSIKVADDWSRDGRFLLYEQQTASSHADLWVLPMFGDRNPFPLVQSPFDDKVGVFSPDGHWVAYTSDESGSQQVYVVPFQRPGDPRGSQGGKWQVSTVGGQVPIWRRDGKEILYQDFQGRIMSAEVSIQGSQFGMGKVHPLLKLPPNTGFDATPDGQRFLIKALGDQYSAPITLLINWTAKVSR